MADLSPCDKQCVIDTLLAASQDIGEWLQLARRQYEEMLHNSPLCPTRAGIERSLVVQVQVGRAVAELRKELEAVRS